MANDTFSPWKSFRAKVPEQQAIFLLRLTLGAYFLGMGLLKYNDPHFDVSFGRTLQHWIDGNPIGIYQQFLKQYALPDAPHIAQWLTDIELALGFSFILGFLIRLSAPIAIVLNINLLLATQHLGQGFLEFNAALIVMSFFMMWGQAGRTWGLDSLFPQKADATANVVNMLKSRPAKKAPKKAKSKRPPAQTEKIKVIERALKSAAMDDDDDDDDDDD